MMALPLDQASCLGTQVKAMSANDQGGSPFWGTLVGLGLIQKQKE